MNTFKFIIHFICVGLSFPFFIIGFIIHFIYQGMEDGWDKANSFYNWITEWKLKWI